ncbi:MAG TPA: hydroxysqualene dehydroxylase HpnE [Methylovirgula sp.]|nr:hydroxysqualene dehydroxylase HpnE [Methylovirgula sp.]
MQGKVHIIGAGLAGLAAALRLADGSRRIALYEAAPQAGGRCRSYFDSTLDMVIDNGNHLLLSGNRVALGYLRELGSEDQLLGPASAEFPFVDLASGERWRLRPNDGAIPWWILRRQRRVPGTRAGDYLGVLGLLIAAKGTPIKSAMACHGLLYERLWQPFFLAALNTAPEEGAASIAAAVLRETLAKGGKACRPLVAAKGLSTAFVTPALRRLESKGVAVSFERRLSAIKLDGNRVSGLEFGGEPVEVAAGERVILAVPAPVAASLLPGLKTPQAFRAIVNGHFKIAPPAGLPPILGVINGTIEWLFAFPDRLSVTISAADRLIDVPRDELAATMWSDVARAAGIAQPLPAWQIIKEKRATFAATVEEEARRPPPRTAFANLLLAGDWTATGLPGTIEGAVRSGFAAAEAILRCG